MSNNSKPIKSYITAILGCAILIVFDQFTKYLASAHLKDQPPFIIIKKVFQLQYLENRGAAFGILQNQKVFFIISGILILAIMGYGFIKIPKTKHYIGMRFCIILIVSGAIGNMIDRISQNYVVDFFYFELIDFPIFNMADIYVVIASISLVLLILFFYKDEDFSFLSLRKK